MNLENLVVIAVMMHDVQLIQIKVNTEWTKTTRLYHLAKPLASPGITTV